MAKMRVHELAAELGSDVPFFLQSQTAVARGRGEMIEPVAPLAAFDGKSLLLVRPGFGVPTPWAYHGLAKCLGRVGEELDFARSSDYLTSLNGTLGLDCSLK